MLHTMERDFNVIIERDSEGYYVATVPSLRGCHTQARSLDELMDRIKEAIELCLEVEGSDAEELDFVGVQRVTVELLVATTHGAPTLETPHLAPAAAN